MCVAAIGLVAGLAGTAVSAAGAMQSANASAAASNYQSQIQQNNAILAQRAAVDARKRGDVEVDNQNRKTAQLSGRQLAVMSANGVDVTEGSPLDILGDTKAMGTLDALTIRSNAEREARGYEAQSSGFTSEAAMSRSRASNAKTAGMFSAAGSLLSGGASVADKWYKLSA